MINDTDKHKLKATAIGLEGSVGLGTLATGALTLSMMGMHGRNRYDLPASTIAKVKKHVAPDYKGQPTVRRYVQSMYNPFTKEVHSAPHLGHLAHELGHASDKVLEHPVGLAASTAARIVSTRGALPLTAAAAYLGASRKKGDKMTTADKAVLGTSGAASAITLGHEAYASLKAHHGLKTMLKSHGKAFKYTKSLIPALGTYAVAAAMPFAGYALARKAREKIDNNSVK